MKEQARGGGGGGAGGGGASSGRQQGDVQDWAALGAESKDFLGQVSELVFLVGRGCRMVQNGDVVGAPPLGAQLVELGSQLCFHECCLGFLDCMRD